MLLLWWFIPLVCAFVVDPTQNRRTRGTWNARKIQTRVLEHVFEQLLVMSQADAIRSVVDGGKGVGVAKLNLEILG